MTAGCRKVGMSLPICAPVVAASNTPTQLVSAAARMWLATALALAVVLLACFAFATAAPLEPTLTEDELRDAFRSLQVKHVVAKREGMADAVTKAAEFAGAKMHFIISASGKAGVFAWADREGPSTAEVGTPNGPADVALLLPELFI